MVYLPHWPIPSSLGNKQIDYETVFDRMAILLQRLGNPHKKMPPVIHIAGTNGKGSAAALLGKIYSIAGYKTDIYTSPHLHHINERIIIDGQRISDNFLYQIMEETRLAAQNIDLTFMEAFTIGAFLAFSKSKSDILIMECGMGGRIDATNIIDNKLASLIMPISFDHMEYLGNSIQRIALEKAMIMRPKTPLIVASQPQKAQEIIKILAQDQKIEAYYYDEDFTIIRDDETGNFDLKFKDITLDNLPKPNLEGQHQYINFGTAISASLAIGDQFKINQNIIKQALKSVTHPSRLQKINNHLNKLLKNNNSEIFIDGAHNSSGAFAISRWIQEQKNDKINFVICGFSKNKCEKEFLEKFKNIATIIAVRVNGEPYPEDPEKIALIGNEINLNIKTTQNLEEAINYISNQTNKACRIVICGSLHLARDVKNH